MSDTPEAVPTETSEPEATPEANADATPATETSESEAPAAPTATAPSGTVIRPRIPPPGLRIKKEEVAIVEVARDRKPKGPRRGGKPGAPGSNDNKNRKRGPRNDSGKDDATETPEVDTPHIPSDEEKAKRKERVAAAKDALARSVDVKGPHVAPARTAIKEYLRNLNEPRQPSDDKFKLLIEAPFHAPPKPRGQGGFGGQGGGGRR